VLAVAAVLKRLAETKERLDRFVTYGEAQLLEYAPVTRAHVKEGWMQRNQTGATMIRAALPADWPVGDKTGRGGDGATNDIAVLPPRGGPGDVADRFFKPTGTPGGFIEKTKIEFAGRTTPSK
jgi:hypothetical protein